MTMNSATANLPFEIAKYRADTHALQHVQPATDEFFGTIAKFNGCRTAEQVRADLANGEAVYTNFSYYRRAGLGPVVRVIIDYGDGDDRHDRSRNGATA
jgi:hypothetical protein